MAYFDANATTPVCRAAAEAVAVAERDFWYNPSSPYPAAAATHNQLERARAELAGLLGCAPERIVFNSGASEGAHSLFQYLAKVFGGAASAAGNGAANVVISAVEHPCVLQSARTFFPDRVRMLPVNEDGVTCIRELEAILTGAAQRPSLVALMAANNETGALQPWQEALRQCRAAGVPLLVDASQWLGKEPASGLGQADFVIGCAHKFGGPKGCGFLKIGDDFTGFYAQRGGAQENDHRAGTENYPAIAGMLAALSQRDRQVEAQRQNWQAARGAFEASLTVAIPGLRINAQGVPRLGNTTSLLLPRHRNTRWVARLARLGFCLSTGSACATGKSGPSHVLAAMGLTPEQAERTVRVSALWEETTDADWQALAAAFIRTWHELEEENGAGGSGSTASVISI